MTSDQAQNQAAAPTPSPAAPAPVDHNAVLKALETEATDLLHRIAAEAGKEEGVLTRELALAKTKLEEFVQWVEAHFRKNPAK
jgi:hypothetical protein